MSDLPDLVFIPEASRRLGSPPDAVRKMIYRCILPPPGLQVWESLAWRRSDFDGFFARKAREVKQGVSRGR